MWLKNRKTADHQAALLLFHQTRGIRRYRTLV
jgi:hypothetical protein